MGKRQGAKDTFNRTIDYLRVSITDRCNLRCVYCSPERKETRFKPSDLLTPDEIARFVRIARSHGLRKVRVTGGEPLLRDDVADVVAAIKDAGVPDISLTTNGLLFSGMARDLKRAGLKRVNISLDTLKPKRYAEMTGGGDIDLVWRSIEAALSEGLAPVKINVVPIRGKNDDEVADFASLTFERDIHIRFIEYMPVGRSSICLKGACVKKDELIDKVSRMGRIRKLTFRGKGPSRNYRLEGATGVIGFISPVSEHFCDYCNRLRITPGGMIKPCLLANSEIDLRKPLRSGADDAELEKIFLRAVGAKPRGHMLVDGAALMDLPSMSEIGG